MISKIIKYMRKASGLKQEELAQRLHIAPSTLSGYEIEHSRPRFEVVERIADACDFDIVFIDRNSGEAITMRNVAESDQISC